MTDWTEIPVQPRLLWPAQAILGEGPVWVDRENALYWVDIKGQWVHRLAWPSGARQSWSTDSPVGAFHPMADGRFIAAMKTGLYIVKLDPDSEKADAQLIMDPEPDRPDNRFNDAKVGPNGGFWAGTMDDNETDPTGCLYRLSPDGECRTIDNDYVVTNGPAFSPDGSVLYHTDTFRKTIYAFDLGPSGNARNKRVFIEIPEDQGYPDGMCVDDEGCLWIAHWGGWRISRWSPGGKPLGYIIMPAAQVTSCVFGGAAQKTMFITTAAIGIEGDAVKEQPDAGGLFAVDLDITGPATAYFDWRG